MDIAFPRTVEITQCPLCGSDPSLHVFFESNSGEAGEDQYLLCKRCGLVFQSPRLSEEDLTSFYSSQYRLHVQGSVEPIDKDLRIQHARAHLLLRFAQVKISKVSHCLDIGSSTGILLKQFKEAYECDVFGVEPGDAYREYSQKLSIPAVESLEELDPELRGSFDLITMAHTLEHLPDPVSYLRDLRKQWLTSTGFLLVEVPNLYGHQALELAHLTAFTPETLRRTLRKAGFRIMQVRTHGKPRSLLIPLYITAIATVANEEDLDYRVISHSRGVQLRRKLGMFWNRLATRYATRWAWLPWPEVE